MFLTKRGRYRCQIFRPLEHLRPGFLGVGNDYYPIPWQSLKYDEGVGGYLTEITDSQLTGAPKYASNNDWNRDDPALRGGVDDYYRGP